MKVKISAANGFYKVANMLRENPIFIRLMSRILPYRLWIIVGIHIGLFALSYVMAVYFLKGTTVAAEPGNEFWPILPIVVFIRLAVFWHYDLYQGLWRYVSFEDGVVIIRATLISLVIVLIIGTISEPLRLESNLYILDWIFCNVLVLGIRFVVRNIWENVLYEHKAKELDNIIIFGPAETAHPLIKELYSNPYSQYKPFAIIDPTKEDRAGLTRMIDVPVWSMRQALLRKRHFKNIAAIVICWSEATRKQLDEVVEELRFLKVPFKTVPLVEDILSERVQVNEIRDVEIEDLLERPPVRIEMKRIRDQLQDKVILVSGGGEDRLVRNCAVRSGDLIRSCW